MIRPPLNRTPDKIGISSRFGQSAAVALLVFLLTGCLTFNRTDKQYHDYIGLHQYARVQRLGNIERAVDIGNGRTIYIYRTPIISSPNISRAEVTLMPDGYGLRLYLNRRGRMLWTAGAVEFHGRPLALMLDGVFRGFVRASGLNHLDVIVLPGLFTKEEAERIARNATHNQNVHQRREKLWN